MAATNAVIKLIESQTTLDLAALAGAANVSSAIPVMLIKFWSASSRITSTTSSTVILPTNLEFSSITGAEIKSFCSNKIETSLSFMFASIGSESVSINSLTLKVGSETSIFEIDKSPRY